MTLEEASESHGIISPGYTASFVKEKGRPTLKKSSSNALARKAT